MSGECIRRTSQLKTEQPTSELKNLCTCCHIWLTQNLDKSSYSGGGLFLMSLKSGMDLQRALPGWRRHSTSASPSDSYVSLYVLNFAPGLALGRMGLPMVNVMMGERRAVFVYLLVAVILEAIAWAVSIYASTAVTTALVGLAISTFYTAAITMGGRLLPRAMHADAFALMSSVGQSGSAFFPLMVGLINTKTGIWVVEPVVVTLLGAQGVLWFLVPKVVRRSE